MPNTVDAQDFYKQEMVAFGQWVGERRNQLNLSLDALSKRVGVEKSYLSRIERGERSNPSFVVVFVLAKELGKGLEEIISIADLQQ